MKSKLQQINSIQTQMYGGGQIPETSYPSVNLVKKAIEENPNNPVKWIVEEYTTTLAGNTWRIRKWNDNEVELFARITHTSTTYQSWSELDEYLPVFYVNYPITFKQTPMEFAAINSPVGSVMERWVMNTTTQSSHYAILRPAGRPYMASITFTVDLHVIGYL